MKHILFIIPCLTTGGTNSSLDSLYPLLKNKYDIKIFAISHQPCDHLYSFSQCILPQNLILSLLLSHYKSQKGFKKILSFALKMIKRFLYYFHFDIIGYYSKKVACKLNKSGKYDVIIAFQEGVATKFASECLCARKIAWIHCNYDKYLSLDKSEEHIYRHFHKIVCVSQYTTSVFRHRYPSLNNKVTSIYNIIYIDEIQKKSEEPIEDKRFNSHKITLLSVGRFNPVKRFRDIPFIASILKSKGIDFIWYIIGPNNLSGEYDCFCDNIIKYNVKDCVISLGGKSNPYPYFKASDLYVCLSESEACPMVFKEAKLLGLPIVTTDFPSSYEFVHEGEGMITSFEMIHEAIMYMIKHKYKVFTLSKLENENTEIVKQIELILN